MDMAYFPFDDQTCMMEFGSWSYHGLHLNLFNDSYVLDDIALDFGEWDVLELTWHRKITYRECCDEPFPTLALKFHLRRRILYYFINLLLPCMVLLAVNPLVFLLPAGTGERIGFCMTIQLSVVVFLQVVSEHTPQTADSIPLIEQFFTATIFLVGSTVMTNIFLLYIHYKGMLHIPVPGWMRTLVLIHLARLTGMTGTAQTFSKISPMDYVEDLIIENMDTDFDSRPPSMMSGLHSAKPPTTALEKDDFLHHKVDLLYRKLADTTRSIDAKVRTMSRQMTRQSTQYFLTFEWRCVGLVLDRFLMYMTILVTIIISVAIFTQAPHF
ncbi:CHRNA7 [Branchiostoma lanceolatum]|uniref:CHRNA7 protein n=1 Tax=Branchiostoma lanceolatum TaxID=7740 RepID=A0A8J9YPX7_BRALA|nr:CHRNA7 [Branchiostoma lanceolatum]